MKKIKHYALGLLGVALVTAGFYACSSEEASTLQLQQEEFNTTVLAKFGDDFEEVALATIEDNRAVPLYDTIQLKTALVSKGLFAEIESIDLDYGFNPEESKFEAFLTIIGKNTGDFALVAFQAELIKDGDRLFIMNPETSPPGLFKKHSCVGQNCRKCAFERSGFLGWRIEGCKECGAANDPQQAGYCNHSINGGGNVAPIVKEIVKAAI